MHKNRDAEIARDPFKKCNYFLSLFEGMDTEGWVEMQDKWLEDVMEDSSLLPWQMNEWQVMEKEFKKAFMDYARHEKANDELRKLKIKDGNIDAYIARFTQLAHQGGHNVNEPTILTMFSQGLPTQLTHACLDQYDLDSFNEWTVAAQRNHKIYLKKQALKGLYGQSQPPPLQRTPNKEMALGRGSGRPPTKSAQVDPNTMDTSTT